MPTGQGSGGSNPVTFSQEWNTQAPILLLPLSLDTTPLYSCASLVIVLVILSPCHVKFGLHSVISCPLTESGLLLSSRVPPAPPPPIPVDTCPDTWRCVGVPSPLMESEWKHQAPTVGAGQLSVSTDRRSTDTDSHRVSSTR